MNLEQLIRPNIKKLVPYSSARDEFKGKAMVNLDANESPYSSEFNRYPDSIPRNLLSVLKNFYNTENETVALGNGSDEILDLIFRIFCNPGKDNVITISPSYGMYDVLSDINDVELRKAPLNERFEMDSSEVLSLTDKDSKLILLCSPNNPSGNILNLQEIEKILESFQGIVVIDEAYIEFSNTSSLSYLTKKYDNLIITRTFSKALGGAGLRVGVAISSEAIIQLINNIKPPYNLSTNSINKATDLITNLDQKNISETKVERAMLLDNLPQLPFVKEVFPSEANFILVRVESADELYNFLKAEGIVIRNRSKLPLCDDCVRISIGTPNENRLLIKALKKFENEKAIIYR